MHVLRSGVQDLWPDILGELQSEDLRQLVKLHELSQSQSGRSRPHRFEPTHVELEKDDVPELVESNPTAPRAEVTPGKRSSATDCRLEQNVLILIVWVVCLFVCCVGSCVARPIPRATRANARAEANARAPCA
jgi:hypothetical protein